MPLRPTIKFCLRLFIGILFIAPTFSVGAAETTTSERPNLVLIMVDDMGFSDIGCYGGEIETPNLDDLATGGIRFSHFYNNSRCCPTRATLLTGLASHLTGIGHMTGAQHDRDMPSYRGALNRKCVTIAEVLRPAGYATLMSGKWHLGERDQSYWPLQRGFDKFYGCLTGSMRYFTPHEPKHIMLMNEKVEQLESTTERRYYTTDAFTDQAISFVEESVAQDRDQPFFLYLAYNAPHWPLQAHEEDIDKYRERYSMGWDELRQQRYQRQIELGLIDATWKLSPRDERAPEWNSLSAERQKVESLRMAVYAAMIDRVDQNIGKLRDSLTKLGVADNTLILFLSDNGACQEGPIPGNPDFMDPEKRNLEDGCRMANYGRLWANASSTPFRYYKHRTFEGGAATPFIMNWPARIKPQQDWFESNAHIADVMPTILDLTQAKYPSTAHGNKIPALSGISLAPAIDGEPLDRQTPIFNEHEDNGLVIDGDWKLVANDIAVGTRPKEELWELYNLRDDRTELNNLADTHPERVSKMAAAWRSWADQAQVFPKPKKKARRNHKRRSK